MKGKKAKKETKERKSRKGKKGKNGKEKKEKGKKGKNRKTQKRQGKSGFRKSVKQNVPATCIVDRCEDKDCQPVQCIQEGNNLKSNMDYVHCFLLE